MPGGVCVYVCIYQHLGDRAMQILIYIFVMRRASVAGEDGTQHEYVLSFHKSS